MIRILKRLLCICFLMSAALATAELPKEIRVTNTDLREFEGIPQGIQNQRFSLVTRDGQGEATFYFTSDQIQEIDFLDLETLQEAEDLRASDDWSGFTEKLEAVWLKRSPYVKFLNEPTLAQPGIELMEAYLHTNRDMEAATLGTTILRMYPDSEFIKSHTLETLMLAYLRLELTDRAQALAKEWVEQHAVTEPDAFGCWILGECYFNQEEYAKARWISLRPIAFATRLPTRKLPDCYTLVAACSWHLGQSEEAAWWLSEAEERFPDGLHTGRHRETLQKIREWIAEQEAEQTQVSDTPAGPATDDTSPSDPNAAPEKDLSLPLDTVRKLSTNPETAEP